MWKNTRALAVWKGGGVKRSVLKDKDKWWAAALRATGVVDVTKAAKR